jgi:hypothetical protein
MAGPRSRPRSHSFAGNARPLCSSPSPPGCTYISCVGQPLYVSGGLPSGEPGAIGWCGVHAICRRSRVFHRRDIIRAASRTILNTRCRDSDGRSFSVHHRKTRIMRRSVRQYRAGLVVNRHLNVVRTDFDRLKATLTNCVRLGPESQNHEGHSGFRFHLEGRVGFVEMINPRRASPRHV